jgi:hypothetical protein
LLNAKEEVRIKAIVINCLPSVEAQSRIVGGTFMSIDQYDDTLRQKFIRMVTKGMDQGALLVGIAVAVVPVLLAASANVLSSTKLMLVYFVHLFHS